jgi:hypothetical protein
VGVLAQQSPPLAAAISGRGTSRRGLALPSAMLALVAIAILLGGVFVFADLSAKSVRNRERAIRATHVAEAGINHGLGLLRGSLRMHSFTRILRGSDNQTGTAAQQADDSVFVGWGLAAQDQIPWPAGQTYQGHTYRVTVADDPADTDGDPKADMNGRIRLWCRATTTEGATAEVFAIVGATPMPGVATDGNTNYSGSPQILGACGSAHANGNLSGGGSPVVQIHASATGTSSGDFNLPNGSDAPKLSGEAEVPIPDLNPLNFCAGADYRLTSGGTVVNQLTNLVVAAATGWVMASGPPEVKWVLSTGLLVNGTYCVEGNVVISGNTGSVATPSPLSVIATGSIEVSGNPFLVPEHDDGILFLAGGDLSLSGVPQAGANNFSGLMYAGAQCKTSGNFTVFGQLLCANGPQPLNAIDHGAVHNMSGNWIINFDCSGNVLNRRRVLFWYPRIGT